MPIRAPRFIPNEVKAAALIGATAFSFAGCQHASTSMATSSSDVLPPYPGERHLRNVRQLTFGAQNAEAYFSHDGKRLIFQSTRNGRGCDQQYVMNVDG